MRYSKEREAILNYISSTKEHPTAKKVYEKIKNILPSLSLGTVYRNLSQLVESGKIIRISLPGEYDRFDATTLNHFHLYCLKCNSIMDIMEIDTNLEKKIYNNVGFKVVSHDLLFKGFCKKCLKEEKNYGIKR